MRVMALDDGPDSGADVCLSIAVHRCALALVGLAVCAVPQPVVPPAGSAGVPRRGHGPDAKPKIAWAFLLVLRSESHAGPADFAPPPSLGRHRGDAPTTWDTPGCATHGRTQTAEREQTWEALARLLLFPRIANRRDLP